MATGGRSVYYDCLRDFQKDITTGIIQIDINVNRLTERAKIKGILPSGYHARLDSVAPRDKRVSTFVARCIESVKQNERLFHRFLVLLEETGLQHLIRRIRRRLERKVTPPSHDSGISASATTASQSLPPLPEKTTTLPSHESHPRNDGGRRQSLTDRRTSRGETKLRPISSSNEREEKDTSEQSSTSPSQSNRSSLLPVEETQEDDMEDLVMSTFSYGSTKNLRYLEYDKMLAETEKEMLQKQARKLIKDKETLEKRLKEKEVEITNLMAAHQKMSKEIRDLKEQMGKDKKLLDELRKRVEELEKELKERTLYCAAELVREEEKQKCKAAELAREEHKYKAAEQEREEEECKCRAAEQDREEEEIKHNVGSRHHKSPAECNARKIVAAFLCMSRTCI